MAALPFLLRVDARRIVGLLLRLQFCGSLDWETMVAYFAARAIPGIEHVVGSTYRRTAVIDGDPGVLEL